MLDDVQRRRYCLIIFAGCTRGPPPTSPGVEHVRIGGFRPRFVLHFSTRFLVICSCDVTSAKPTTDSDYGSVPGQAQIRPCIHTSNHHAATAVRLSEVDASGDALSAPIHCEQQRHRRSEWAGLSWPTDDRDEGGADDDIGYAGNRGTAPTMPARTTMPFARSFGCSRARPHASASSEN